MPFSDNDPLNNINLQSRFKNKFKNTLLYNIYIAVNVLFFYRGFYVCLSKETAHNSLNVKLLQNFRTAVDSDNHVVSYSNTNTAN